MAYGKKPKANKKPMAKKPFKPCSSCPNKAKCRKAGKCLKLKR